MEWWQREQCASIVFVVLLVVFLAMRFWLLHNRKMTQGQPTAEHASAVLHRETLETQETRAPQGTQKSSEDPSALGAQGTAAIHASTKSWATGRSRLCGLHLITARMCRPRILPR